MPACGTSRRSNSHYRRGIFKIAYELAFLWLGESYLDDPMAAKLRSAVLEGVEPESLGIRGTIQIGCEVEPLRFWAADSVRKPLPYRAVGTSAPDRYTGISTRSAAASAGRATS
jgi:hypothetical protein